MRQAALWILLVFTAKVQAQVLPTFGDSRTGTAGFQFLKIHPDARGAGMAGAYSALVNDPSATVWNPAALSRIGDERNHALTNFTTYLAGSSFSHAAYAIRTSQSAFLGWGLQYLNLGEYDETTEFQPRGTGRTFKAIQYALSMSYAKILTEQFSFGLTGRFASEQYPDVNLNNVMFDLGLHYNVGVRDIKFAVVIRNFGVNVSPDGTVTRLRVNGNVESSDFESVSVPVIFRLGACGTLYKEKNHLITLAAELNHPTDNNETLAIAAEYTMRNILVLRSGYEFGFDATAWPSVGAGVKLRQNFGTMRFDYTWSNYGFVGSTHRLGLYFAWSKKKEENR